MTTAGTTQSMANYFKQYFGYTGEELYATTYGRPAGLVPLQSGLACEYVKGVRNLIKAVAQYTNSPVHVIAYSMGGPISRKAILGGNCVENGEYLGEPITHLVDAYLGVAGAQRGAASCGSYAVGVCNSLTGMSCGSAFLNDINKQSRYEGRRVYVLESNADDIVGYNACGGHPSEINGADNTVVLNGLKHLQICSTQTAQVQHNLITTGNQ